ncbi:MAG: D-alanyl-lipoteichoic acid biosynthesis protein DltD [Chloroflexi bacterium]|nr:D-alanyl-lipoteichoic acid biosynthesis protein DltD [Chloroflexota bacterium]
MATRHLTAAAIAIGLIAAAVVGLRGYLYWLEARDIHSVAPTLFDLKNQGTELQAAAFRQSDLLVIYGSSELEGANPYHASNVFEAYPTGFTIFPVGRGETTTLIMLQDLASVGSELDGKKVVVSVSPPWFFLHDRTPNFYATNYSAIHLSALVFSTDLSYETKQLAVRQLVQSPTLFTDDPLVDFAAQKLTQDDALSRSEYMAVLPLGKLHNLLQSLQDDWATLEYLSARAPADPRQRLPAGIDWQQLTHQALVEQQAASSNNDLGFDNTIWSTKYAKLVAQRTDQHTDAWFVDNLQHTAEYTDLDILLRGLTEMGAQPLLLSQPIPGKYYDTIGISAQARAEYYTRLRQIASTYNVPEVDFQDHDSDIYFVTDPNSHLSREGWVYYDRALQAFYDGSLPELARTEWRAGAVLPGDFAGAAVAVQQ